MTDIKCAIRCCAVVLMMVLVPYTLHAQESTSETKEEKRSRHASEKESKNFRFSILGGPGYSPDYGFLVGGSTLMTFNLPSMEGISDRRSVLPVSFALSFGSELGYSIVTRPQFYIKQDNIRITGEFQYSYLPSNYYGVGFSQNKYTQRGSATTLYMSSLININPIILFRLSQSDWFVGPTLSLQRDKITDPSSGVAADEEYISLGGTESGLVIINNGLGVSLSYDSRDVAANAYRGIYFDVKGLGYGDYFGGDNRYMLFNVDFRQYVQLSKSKVGRTLAYSIYSRNIFGDAPFTRLSTVGSPFDLRGYYEGQYRDKSAHVAMVEYRHKFFVEPVDFWSKIANRLGFVVWMGVGALGSSPFEIEGFLPNYGAGLRIEVQPRMNFRVDVGRSPIEKQTLVYLNMTEAF